MPEENNLIIAVDAMGGDHAPHEIVKGAHRAALELKNLKVILVGELSAIQAELNRFSKLPNLEVQTASDVIEMGEEAAWSVRSKSNSSIVVGTRLVKEGKVHAFLSAGNTGAVVSAALLTYGRIKGISRPAIAIVVPTPYKPVVILDVGATADCKPEHLVRFAQMGSLFAKKILNIENPTVGLLSIGEEKSKGNEITVAAHKLLTASQLNFFGNVEGNDIPKGKVDICVCDGFTGNVVLKLMEGLASTIFKQIRLTAEGSLISKIGALLLKPGLKKLIKQLDYEEYGGAQLLGVDGVCIISHGSSSSKAIKNAIKVAAKTIQENLIGEIKESLKSS